MPRRTALLTAITIAAGCFLMEAFDTPAARTDTIAVQVNHPGGAISPTMFGVFFEDINFAADGGLYPERVKNRSFEFTEPLTGWREPVPDFGSRGELVIRTEGGLNENNPHYLRLRSYTDEGFGVVNSGFRGMGVESGAEYVLSAYVRARAGGIRAVSARLMDARRQTLAEAELTGFSDQWKRYETTVRPSGTDAHAQLEI